MAVLQQALLVPNTSAAQLTWHASITIDGTGFLQTVDGASDTLYTKFPGTMVPSATRVRITITSSSVAQTLNNVTIGPRATTGDVYDVSAVTAITFSGSASIALPAAYGEYVSDTIEYTTTPGTDLVFAVNKDAVTNSVTSRIGLSATTVAFAGFSPGYTAINSYIKASVQEADNTNRTGTPTVTATNQSYFIRKIEFGSLA